MSSDEKLLTRRRRARDRLYYLRAELDRLSLIVLPKSPLGRANRDTLNNWRTLAKHVHGNRHLVICGWLPVVVSPLRRRRAK